MIPFLDLNGQYKAIKHEIDPAVIAVLESGQYVLGPAVRGFEEKFERAYDIKHAIACSSGTAALHLAFAALDIGRDDDVLTCPMTFVATASAIDMVGARPVFADMEWRSATLDPAMIEAAITPKTKAIVPIHLYGQCADMDPILEIARRRNLLVVEDAAQAHGATYKGRAAGTMGNISCFSFYPGKNLGAYGEGGLVATQSDELAKKLRMLRDWGQDRKYNHILKGFNYRMDGVQGAVLGVKMDHIEAWTENRRRVADHYRTALASIPGVELPEEIAGRRHVWHVYGIKVSPEHRERIMAGLGERKIGVNLHYPVPVHLQPCFAEFGHKSGDFPMAELQGQSELSLPMYPEMTDTMIDEVAGALKDVMRQFN